MMNSAVFKRTSLAMMMALALAACGGGGGGSDNGGGNNGGGDAGENRVSAVCLYGLRI